MKKKPLLIYVNPESSGVKEFKLSFKKIFFTSVLVILALVAGLKLAVDVVVDFSQNKRISDLKDQNGVLQAELNKITEKIASLNTNIDFLEQRDDQLRALLDLPQIDSDVRQVGVGGTEPNAVSQTFLHAFPFGK